MTESKTPSVMVSHSPVDSLQHQALALPHAASPTEAHAQQVVRELHTQYQKQRSRWLGYRALFWFLGFMALYMAMLFEQRNATQSYQVHSTLTNVLVPEETVMSSAVDLHRWMRGVFRNVWVDPPCGDGICEAPFEFPEYSWFGCRADCGILSEVVDLTAVRISITWDFNHPPNSIPAADLMSQASWNLCPKSGTPVSYSRGCYYQEDKKFTTLTGTFTEIITDLPDGSFVLVMRRDIFSKTRGVLQNFDRVSAVSYYYRVYIAAVSAMAEQDFEIALLEGLTAAASTGARRSLQTHDGSSISSSYVDYVKHELTRVTTVAGEFNQDVYNTQLVKFTNATCGCWGYNTNSTSSTTWGEVVSPNSVPNILLPWTGTIDPITTEAELNARVCSQEGPGKLTTDPDFTQYKLADDGTLQAITNTSDIVEHCLAVHDQAMLWRQGYIDAVRAVVVDQRLGDQRTTGKVAARNSVRNGLRSYVGASLRELFDPIFITPAGSFALTKMPTARLAVLTDQFVRGTFEVTGPAALKLTRQAIYGGPVTITEMIVRATERIAEIKLQQSQLLDLDVKLADKSPYPELKVRELIAVFAEAQSLSLTSAKCSLADPSNSPCLLLDLGGSTVVVAKDNLPPPSSQIFANVGGANSTRRSLSQESCGKTQEGLLTDYTLQQWDGGKDGYLRIGLAQRGPQYAGVCKEDGVACTRITDAARFTQPYTCKLFPSGDTVPGDMSSADYRLGCELPCERQRECNALCACEDPCPSTGHCECKACLELDQDATRDASYQALVADPNTLAGQTQDKIAPIQVPEPASSGSRRSLLQTKTDIVITEITRVKEQQKTITADMSKLTTQVDRSNQLATERADNNAVLDVIGQIRNSIASGQRRVEERLDEILGKQTKSLEVAQESTKALSAIKGLQEKQAAAVESLQANLNSKLAAIQTSINAGTLEAPEALYRWKETRRDGAESARQTNLATQVVEELPFKDHDFDVRTLTYCNGGGAAEANTRRLLQAAADPSQVGTLESRERNVGNTNRVVSGMMVHQTRRQDKECPKSKFFRIQETCTGPRTIRSYGVDPTLKRGTALYEPDFDDTNGEFVLKFYNCSKLANPTYDVEFEGEVSNKRPRCAELFSRQELPFAFHYYSLKDKEDGFPVFFDINLSEDEAQRWNLYLEEGLYINQNTNDVTVELITYNSQLRVFGYFKATFVFSEGGSIQVDHRLDVVRVELYNTPADKARYAFEIIMSVWICAMMLQNLWQIGLAQVKQGNFMKFFSSGWNFTELASNALLVTNVGIWWYLVVNHMRPFNLSLRHDVYQTLAPQANFLALEAQGANLEAAWADFNALSELIHWIDLFFLLASINILLLMVRLLKLLDFQPRLGVVTRSLWLAGPDLIHFAFVFFMVFVGYSMLAHLIFGNAIEEFQTFDNSVNTCFEILLGNIEVNTKLRALGGLQSIAGAFFFWTYMLLVFMVLLNFLLAIIVDAFCEVKGQMTETQGIHTELYHIMRQKFHQVSNLVRRNAISDDKVEAMLKKWSGAAAKEEQKKKVEEGQHMKLLTVMNEDLDEEDLRAVLLECLKEMPAEPEPEEAEDAEGSTNWKARLGRCLPTARKPMRATPAEVEQAAKFIVDRFGIPTLVEDDEEESAQGGGLTLRQGIQEMRRRAQADGVGGGMSRPLTPAEETLSVAVERLGGVQRLLADSQATLIADQQRLAAVVAQLEQERRQ